MDQFIVTIFARDERQFAAITKQFKIEVLRQTAKKLDGTYAFCVDAFATQKQIKALEDTDYKVEVRQNFTQTSRERLNDVGTGDRYRERINRLKNQ